LPGPSPEFCGALPIEPHLPFDSSVHPEPGLPQALRTSPAVMPLKKL